MDRADLRLLGVLQEHGNLSAAELAERAGLTASTCWRRVTRLEELGVIRKRVALLDREKLGLSVMVFSHVKLAGHGRDALLRFEQAQVGAVQFWLLHDSVHHLARSCNEYFPTECQKATFVTNRAPRGA